MSLRVRKAIIPAAGRGTRHFPASSAVRKELFPLVDRDGVTRPVMHLIVAEALSAGVEEVCIVTSPGGDAEFRGYFRDLTDAEREAYGGRPEILAEAEARARMSERIVFAEQREQEGYGHAVYCARSFAADEPVLILLGDHIYVSETAESCASQMVTQWQQCGGSVSSVQPVGEELIHRLGVVRLESPDGPPWQVSEIVEKPDPATARDRLRSLDGPKPYLAFFGTHLMQPEIFDCLEHNIRHDVRTRGEIQLTDAQALLACRGSYRAAIIDGATYDIGVPEGYAITQAALSSLGPYAQAVREAATG